MNCERTVWFSVKRDPDPTLLYHSQLTEQILRCWPSPSRNITLSGEGSSPESVAFRKPDYPTQTNLLLRLLKYSYSWRLNSPNNSRTPCVPMFRIRPRIHILPRKKPRTTIPKGTDFVWISTEIFSFQLLFISLLQKKHSWLPFIRDFAFFFWSVNFPSFPRFRSEMDATALDTLTLNSMYLAPKKDET